MSQPQQSSPSRPIIVGVDGSEPSRLALRYAVDMASRLGLPLHALVAWDYPTLSWGDAWYPPESMETLEEGALEVAEQEARRVFPAERPDWFTTGTRQGDTADQLIVASRDAAMLVVGTRGHGGFTGLLLGSVSRACAAHAHCPVLIVRSERGSEDGAGLPGSTGS
ncbi:universal stress protein [Microbacterium insulae]|uniref:Universal stress protein n=1 Tax=Microbacterium insulae TaxID=483014 RepID=A0ABW3AER5_9MICO